MLEINHHGRIVRSPRRYHWLTVIAWGTVLVIYFTYVPGRISPLKLPGPRELASAQQQVSWLILTHTASTFYRVMVGFILGSCLGVVVAFFMFAVRWIEALLFSFIEVIRPVPPIALIPFFILWFQLRESGQVTLIGLGCFMVLVVSAHEALKQVDVNLRRAARSLGASGVSYYVQILLPAILPDLIAPLRVSLALAISLAVAAEFMGAQSGIGFLIMIARRTLHTETILLAVIVLGVTAAALDFCLRSTLRFYTRWYS